MNHRNIFENLEFKVAEYDYWDPVTLGLNIDGMLQSLRVRRHRALPFTGLVHACVSVCAVAWWWRRGDRMRQVARLWSCMCVHIIQLA